VIHTERRGHTLLITIDRPHRRNAVDHDTLTAMRTAIGGAGDARAVVLTGAGGHFCAGADLTGLEDATFASLLRDVLHGLRDLPRPTIAAIDGAALGAGTQLAAACDLRVATSDATFGIPAVRLGVAVDHWTIQRLAFDWGFGPARAMLIAGETFSGADAVRLGFVHRTGGLDDAMDWAAELADRAPLTMAAHKLGLTRLEADVTDDPEYQAAFARAWASADLEEGIAAFREKRAPRFEGR
jgi:enoyl-CoA hydratase